MGKGPGWENTREFLASDFNIWTIPQSYSNLETLCNKRIDLVFEVHEPRLWKKKRAILYRVNQWNPPKLIVPSSVEGWTNNSYSLPVKELQSLGLPLLNSFAWMIAYAIHRGITSIAFRGVNLDFAQEADHERDGLMFLLGYLKASGIILDVERTSGLVRNNGILLTSEGKE